MLLKLTLVTLASVTVMSAGAQVTSPHCSQLPSLNSIDWSCFETSVAIVEYNGSTAEVCSGIAIDPWTVLTAGHCIENHTQGNPIEVHAGAEWFFGRKPEALADESQLQIHRDYKPLRSLYFQDRARITLDRPLLLNANLFPNVLDFAIESSVGPDDLYLRIGFGLRSGKNIRTATTVSVYENASLARQSSTLVTNDSLAVRGDSGGPIFVLRNRPETGTWSVMLIATHSTWDSAQGLSFAPLVASPFVARLFPPAPSATRSTGLSSQSR